MALGGVATGSIKAQLAPIAMIKASPSGGAPKDSAMDINKGTKSAADAVFEVNSVKKMINTDTASPIKNKCSPFTASMTTSAITLLAPESFRIALSVIPPPKWV